MFQDRLDYIRKIFAPETERLRKIRESRGETNDRISIHPEEGKLLQLLIRLGGIKKIVEIGTLAGYSTLWMAEALPEDGRIYTIEKDERRAQIAQKNLHSFLPEGESREDGASSKISLFFGAAPDILPKIEEHSPFDMIFIDADKLNYLNYLVWAEKHMRKGGLIVGDNTFLFDAAWKDEPVDRVRETARHAMREFNNRLADPAKYLGIMLPTQEGLTIAVKLF